MIFAILVLERIFRADKEQPTFSVGLAQDAIWFLMGSVQFLLIGWYLVLLQGIYESHFSFLTIDAIRAWPYWVRVVWGILLSDLIAWLHHWVRHKVPLFWLFHKLHHSQREMNLFTDLRYHAMEYVFARTVAAIPLFILTLNIPTVVIINFIQMWHSRFYHANIRMNFGPLRYILVSPQSHRIHHSVEREHFDKNFGVTFSIWARIFGTQFDDASVYPKTGLTHDPFPVEQELGIKKVLLSTLRQFFYPFRETWAMFKRRALNKHKSKVPRIQ